MLTGSARQLVTVAQLMKEAGLAHGGFYRHFDSREHLVPEAAQRALSQAAHGPWQPAKAGGGVLPRLVDGYHSAWPRDYPESGCGVAGIAADVAPADTDQCRRRVETADPE